MNILITGCAGFVGAHLSRYLLLKKHRVLGIDDLSGGYRENCAQGLRFFKADLADHAAVDDVFKQEKIDVVFHFAAYAAEGLSRYILKHNCDNNILSSMNVVNACVNYSVKKLIFASSIAVYGNQRVPFTETMTPHPDDPYGASKYFVEMVLKQTSDHFGLEYAILRLHNIIGIYQNIWDRYRNVLGIWTRNVLNHEPISIFGDGLQTRAFSDIAYCLEPFERLMHGSSGEIFNVGSDTFYTIKELAEMFQEAAKKLGYHAEIEHREFRNEVRHAYCDHTKAAAMLQFKDATDIPSVMYDLIAWAKDQPVREVKKVAYEITKNMYPSWM